jgi:hypothetical protein
MRNARLKFRRSLNFVLYNTELQDQKELLLERLEREIEPLVIQSFWTKILLVKANNFFASLEISYNTTLEPALIQNESTLSILIISDPF